jgi:O-antigen ligase
MGYGAFDRLPGMRGGLTTAQPIAAPAAASIPVAAMRRDSSVWSPSLKLAAITSVLLVGRVLDLHPVGQSLPIAKLLFPLGIILVCVDRAVMQRIAVFTTVQGRAFGFFFLAIALSVPFSILRSEALPRFIDMVVGTLPYVAVIATAALVPTDLKRLMKALVVSIVIIVLALLGGLGVNLDGRMTVSTMYDPNDLALVAVTILPFGVLALREKSLWWKLLGAGACAGTLVVIGLTASRGGLVGFSVVVLALLLRRGFMKLRWKVLIVAALLGGLAFTSSTLWDRMSDLSSGEDYNLTGESGRKEVWTRGLTIFTAHPITGVGVYQYWVADGKFPGRGRQDLSWHTAHNSVLQVAVELGVVGLIPWFLLFLPTVSTARRARLLHRHGLLDHSYVEIGDVLMLSLIGFFVSGFFLSAGYSMIAMTLAAFGMSYSSMVRRAEKAMRAAPVSQGASAIAPTGALRLERGGL